MKTVTEASVRCQVMGGRLCVTNSGKVYDLTDFANRHPGGKELIENHAGRDVTQVMQSHEQHVHSGAAYKILEKYYVGDLQTSTARPLWDGGKNTSTGSPARMIQRKLTNGVSNGTKNGHVNGYSNGQAKTAVTNGHANGHANGLANGHTTQQADNLDWSKPIFWQVGSLGEKYFDWVHSPVDTPLRLFYSDIAEHLSKSYWWLVLLYWVPISFYTLWYSYSLFQQETVLWNLVYFGKIEVTAASLPALFLCGILLWTFDEYVVHRWLFHCKPPSTSKFLITLHFLFHGQHHKSPMDKQRLVFPPLPATGLAFLIYQFYRLLAPPAVSMTFLSGTIIGYLCYDLVHYYLHHGQPSLVYFKNLKTYHTKHHFKDQQKGFGISSKLWDYPFGTLIK